MAQSRNNRKKSKKKNKNHASPQTASYGSVKKVRDWKQEQVVKFIALGVMVVGFLLSMIGGMASLIGYPAAFLGAAVSMTLTKWDTTNHKITKVVLCIFCILCAMQFVLLMTGNAAA